MKRQRNHPFEKDLTRRDFVRTAGLAAGALLTGLSGCTRGTPRSSGVHRRQRYAGQTLRVFVYSGAWEKAFNQHFVPGFEMETGAKVVVEPGWWDSIPKLKASPPGQPAFDLVLTDATQGYPAIKEGLFRKIDFARIPNRANLAPAALDNWVVREHYGITFPDAVMTLGYNKALCPIEPTNWADLLDERYKGKVGMYNAFYMSLYTFAAMMAAQRGEAGTAHRLIADNLQSVIDFAKMNRDRVKLWWPTSTDMVLYLTQKDVALGNMHSNDMIEAVQNNPELGAVVPEKDRASVLLMWVIVADTKVPDLAHEAINMLFSEQIQTALARSGEATAIPAVAAKVAAENPLWAQFYLHTPEQLAAISYYPYDTYMAHWGELVRVWDQEILRKS